MKTLQDRKRLPRVQLIGCQFVKMVCPKDLLKCFQKLRSVTIWVFHLCQKLTFWVLSQFNFRVLSKLDFLSFGAICGFEFHNSLSFFYVVTIGVIDFFWLFEIIVLLLFYFFILVVIWVFFSVGTIWILDFFHHLSFIFFSHFEFCHKLDFVIIN